MGKIRNFSTSSNSGSGYTPAQEAGLARSAKIKREREDRARSFEREKENRSRSFEREKLGFQSRETSKNIAGELARHNLTNSAQQKGREYNYESQRKLNELSGFQASALESQKAEHSAMAKSMEYGRKKSLGEISRENLWEPADTFQGTVFYNPVTGQTRTPGQTDSNTGSSLSEPFEPGVGVDRENKQEKVNQKLDMRTLMGMSQEERESYLDNLQRKNPKAFIELSREFLGK